MTGEWRTLDLWLLEAGEALRFAALRRETVLVRLRTLVEAVLTVVSDVSWRINRAAGKQREYQKAHRPSVRMNAECAKGGMWASGEIVQLAGSGPGCLHSV